MIHCAMDETFAVRELAAFFPDDDTLRRYRITFARFGLYPGYVGRIERITSGLIRLEGTKKAWPSSQFRRVDRLEPEDVDAYRQEGERLFYADRGPTPFRIGDRVRFRPSEHCALLYGTTYRAANLYPTMTGRVTAFGRDGTIEINDLGLLFHWSEFEALDSPDHPSAEPPVLTDGVVRLSRYTLADVAAQVAGEDEETARRFGWYPEHSTPQTVRAAIQAWQEQWDTNGPIRAFAVRAVATGALVGSAELRIQEGGIAHLSWATHAPYRGQGLAGRAARLLCAYAFEHLGIERLEAYIEVDNLASRGVARKAGFIQEGILRQQARFGAERRDMILFARLPSDPMI